MTGNNLSRRTILLATMVLLLSLFPKNSFAGEINLFGPKKYLLAKGNFNRFYRFPWKKNHNYHDDHNNDHDVSLELIIARRLIWNCKRKWPYKILIVTKNETKTAETAQVVLFKDGEEVYRWNNVKLKAKQKRVFSYSYKPLKDAGKKSISWTAKVLIPNDKNPNNNVSKSQKIKLLCYKDDYDGNHDLELRKIDVKKKIKKCNKTYKVKIKVKNKTRASEPAQIILYKDWKEVYRWSEVKFKAKQERKFTYSYKPSEDADEECVNWTAEVVIPYDKVTSNNTYGPETTKLLCYNHKYDHEDDDANKRGYKNSYICDKLPPVPDIDPLPTITGECTTTVPDTPTATDVVAGSITGTTSDPLSYSEQGIYTVTWTYDDGNGNTSTQMQTVIVDDVTAPVPDVDTLPDIEGEGNVTVSTIPSATDNCVRTIAATTTDPLEYTEQGESTLTWTYDDGNGNVITQQQTIRVAFTSEDNTPPVPDTYPLPTVIGECSAIVAITPTATDVVAGPITGTTSDPLSYSAQGTHTVNWIYDDGNGNTSTQMQTIIVDDVTAPVPDIDPLPDIEGEGSVTVSTTPTATDNCAGTGTVTTTNPLEYSTLGEHTITWTYDDGNGNISTQQQTVKVTDTTPPVTDVDPLPPITGECSASVTNTPTATDAIAGLVTGTTSDPLTYTEQGTYTITWSYDDGNGNTSTQTQTVIVDDVTALVPGVNPLPVIEGEGSVTVSTTPTATDNCVGTVTGTTTDPLEYSSLGEYTITWTYDDGNGNVSTQQQTIRVIDTIPPVPDVTSLPTITGECSATLATTPTATDAVAGQITGTTTDSLTYTEQGTHIVT